VVEIKLKVNEGRVRIYYDVSGGFLSLVKM
jgi:hypothetical protein